MSDRDRSAWCDAFLLSFMFWYLLLRWLFS